MTSLVIGGSGGIAFANGEAFELTGAGYGLQFFLGTTLSAVLSSVGQVRAGVTLNTHSDGLSQDRVNVLALHIETRFTGDVSPVRFHVGPRIAWVQVSRSIFARKLSGFGFGGTAGAELPVGSRSSVETGLVYTASTFGGADIKDGPPDPDAESHGAFWEFRLGVVYRLK